MISKVYFLRDGQFIKIGISKNPSMRIRNLQVGNPRPIEVVRVWDCYDEMGLDAYKAEKTLHNELKDVRQCGEWFLYEGDDFTSLLEAVSRKVEEMAKQAFDLAAAQEKSKKDPPAKRPRGRPRTGFDKTAYQREYMRERRKKPVANSDPVC